jgi:small GTP-binding protein
VRRCPRRCRRPQLTARCCWQSLWLDPGGNERAPQAAASRTHGDKALHAADALHNIMKMSGRGESVWTQARLRLLDAFRVLDKDGTGAISKEELKQSLSEMDLGLQPAEIDALWKAADADGDGQLVFREFAAQFGRRGSGHEAAQAVARSQAGGRVVDLRSRAKLDGGVPKPSVARRGGVDDGAAVRRKAARGATARPRTTSSDLQAMAVGQPAELAGARAAAEAAATEEAVSDARELLALGDAAMTQGDAVAAAAFYKDGLRLDPGCRRLAQGLKKAQGKLGHRGGKQRVSEPEPEDLRSHLDHVLICHARHCLTDFHKRRVRACLHAWERQAARGRHRRDIDSVRKLMDLAVSDMAESLTQQQSAVRIQRAAHDRRARQTMAEMRAAHSVKCSAFSASHGAKHRAAHAAAMVELDTVWEARVADSEAAVESALMAARAEHAGAMKTHAADTEQQQAELRAAHAREQAQLSSSVTQLRAELEAGTQDCHNAHVDNERMFGDLEAVQTRFEHVFWRSVTNASSQISKRRVRVAMRSWMSLVHAQKIHRSQVDHSTVSRELMKYKVPATYHSAAAVIQSQYKQYKLRRTIAAQLDGHAQLAALETQRELSALRDVHQASCAELESNHRRAHEAAVAELSVAWEVRLAASEAAGQAALQRAAVEHEKRERSASASGVALAEEHFAAISQLASEHEASVAMLLTDHATEVSEQKEMLSAQQVEHDAATSSLHDEHSEVQAVLAAKYRAELEDDSAAAVRDWSAQLAAAKTAGDAALQLSNAEHENAIQAMASTLEEQLRDASASQAALVTSLGSESEAKSEIVLQEHAAAILEYERMASAMREERTAAKAAWQDEHSRAQAELELQQTQIHGVALQAQTAEWEAKLAALEASSRSALDATVAKHVVALNAQQMAHAERERAASASEVALVEAHEAAAAKLEADTTVRMRVFELDHKEAVSEHERVVAAMRDEYGVARAELQAKHRVQQQEAVEAVASEWEAKLGATVAEGKISLETAIARAENEAAAQAELGAAWDAMGKERDASSAELEVMAAKLQQSEARSEALSQELEEHAAVCEELALVHEERASALLRVSESEAKLEAMESAHAAVVSEHDRVAAELQERHDSEKTELHDTHIESETALRAQHLQETDAAAALSREWQAKLSAHEATIASQAAALEKHARDSSVSNLAHKAAISRLESAYAVKSAEMVQNYAGAVAERDELASSLQSQREALPGDGVARDGDSESVVLQRFSTAPNHIFPRIEPDNDDSEGVLGAELQRYSTCQTFDDSWPELKQQKIILLGDCNVGKSSLLGCLQQAQFQPEYESTVGIQHHKVKSTLRGVTMNLQVWDLAGESSFGILSKVYLKNVKGAMIVYDVTSEDSFARVPEWIGKIRAVYPECPLFLCGNKIDEGEIMIDAKGAKAVCQQHNICGCCQVSAKDGANVHVAFHRLAAAVALADPASSQFPESLLVELRADANRSLDSDTNPDLDESVEFVQKMSELDDVWQTKLAGLNAASEAQTKATLEAARAEHEAAMEAQKTAHEERLRAVSASDSALAQEHEAAAARALAASEERMSALLLEQATAVAEHQRTMVAMRGEHLAAHAALEAKHHEAHAAKVAEIHKSWATKLELSEVAGQAAVDAAHAQHEASLAASPLHLYPGETVTREHHLRMVDLDPTIAQHSTLTLDEDFHAFMGKGDDHVDGFKADLLAKMAATLGVDVSRLEVIGMHEGSVKIGLVVKPPPADSPADAPTVAQVKANLAKQCADPDSDLRAAHLPTFKDFERHSIADTSSKLIATLRELHELERKLGATEQALAAKEAELTDQETRGNELAATEATSKQALDAAVVEHEAALAAQVAAHDERAHAASASEVALAEAHEVVASEMMLSSDARVEALLLEHTAAVSAHQQMVAKLHEQQSEECVALKKSFCAEQDKYVAAVASDWQVKLDALQSESEVALQTALSKHEDALSTREASHHQREQAISDYQLDLVAVHEATTTGMEMKMEALMSGHTAAVSAHERVLSTVQQDQSAALAATEVKHRDAILAAVAEHERSVSVLREEHDEHAATHDELAMMHQEQLLAATAARDNEWEAKLASARDERAKFEAKHKDQVAVTKHSIQMLLEDQEKTHAELKTQHHEELELAVASADTEWEGKLLHSQDESASEFAAVMADHQAALEAQVEARNEHAKAIGISETALADEFQAAIFSLKANNEVEMQEVEERVEGLNSEHVAAVAELSAALSEHAAAASEHERVVAELRGDHEAVVSNTESSLLEHKHTLSTLEGQHSATQAELDAQQVEHAVAFAGLAAEMEGKLAAAARAERAALQAKHEEQVTVAKQSIQNLLEEQEDTHAELKTQYQEELELAVLTVTAEWEGKLENLQAESDDAAAAVAAAMAEQREANTSEAALAEELEANAMLQGLAGEAEVGELTSELAAAAAEHECVLSTLRDEHATAHAAMEAERAEHAAVAAEGRAALEEAQVGHADAMAAQELLLESRDAAAQQSQAEFDSTFSAAKTQVQALAAQHTAVVSSHEAAVSALREERGDAHRERDAYAAEVASQCADADARAAALAADHTAALAEHGRVVSVLRAEHDERGLVRAELEALHQEQRQRHEELVAEQQREHANLAEEQREEHKAASQELRLQHTQLLAQQRREHEEVVATLDAQHFHLAAEQQREQAAAVASLDSEWEARFAAEQEAQAVLTKQVAHALETEHREEVERHVVDVERVAAAEDARVEARVHEGVEEATKQARADMQTALVRAYGASAVEVVRQEERLILEAAGGWRPAVPAASCDAGAQTVGALLPTRRCQRTASDSPASPRRT